MQRYDPKAQEWYFHMMNDPEYFEKCRYIDTINDYNNIIVEFQRLYEQTPVTDRFARARIQSGMKNQKEIYQKLRLNMRCLRNTRQELQ
jgi:hypothetical protein